MSEITKADLDRVESKIQELTLELKQTTAADSEQRKSLKDSIADLKEYVEEQRKTLTKVDPPTPPAPAPVVLPPALKEEDPPTPPAPLQPERRRNLFRA